MFCTKCGQQLREGSNFCSQCGRPTGPEAAASRTAPAERLVRIRSDKKIAGVCAGFARYMGVDVTLVRVVWLGIAFTAGGWGLPPHRPMSLLHLGSTCRGRAHR